MNRIFTIFICFCLASSLAFAQFDMLKKKAEEKIEKTVEEKLENKEQPKENQDNKQPAEEKKNDAINTPVKADLKSYSKYDFVPGDKVIFYEDFEQEEIGDYPVMWGGSSSGEIKTTNLYGGKWFQMTGREMVAVLKKNLDLTDNFILEFDVIPVHYDENRQNEVGDFYITLYQGEGEFLDPAIYAGMSGLTLTIGSDGWSAIGYKDQGTSTRNGKSDINPIKPGVVNHVIIWVQKSRLRVYYTGKKVLDLPSVIYDGTYFNRFLINTWTHSGLPMFKNILFTNSTPDIKSKLITEGKIVSHGIYFDVASDQIKPESAGTLSGIAKVLKENPTVNVKIVGHTDSDGTH
jgi:flagellar motor protein MotB